MSILHQNFSFDVWPRKGKSARVRLYDQTPAPRVIPKGAVRVNLGLGLEGRAEPLYLTIGVDPSRDEARREARDTAPLTAVALRAIPIGRLVDEALESLAKDLETGLDRLDPRDTPEPIRRSFERRLEAARKAAAKGRVGRRGHGLDHYEEVARVYLAAKARRPTKAVMDHFNVERSTANKWVERARHDYGLLAPTTPGKPSGLDEPRTRTRRRGKG